MELTSGPLDFLVEPLGETTKLPVDQLKFVLCLLFSYPLAYVYRVLPKAFQKDIYTIAVGIFMVIFCFGLLGVVHFIVPTIIMYVVFLRIPAQYAPKAAFGFMFAYLSGLHIYRMVYDYKGYKMDATSIIMVLVIKISSLACNYYDGTRLEKEPDSILAATKNYAIPQLPSLISYYSYVCYFPTFLSGPAFNYVQYNDWIHLRIYAHPKYNPEGRLPPFPVVDVLKKFLFALVLAVLFTQITATFPMDIFFIEGGMDHMSLISRYLYLLIGVLGVRCRYYFIWKLSEGAGIVSGLGFAGYDNSGKPLNNALDNIDVWKIETCGSLRDITTYWNIKTGEWLKNYIYFRQTKNPNKDRVPTYALYLTNSASAFWHGFYPGYYLAFLYAAFTTDIARQLRSTFRPLVTEGQGKSETLIYPGYYIYDVIGRILALLTFNYGFVTFIGLSIPDSFTAYQNLGFLGHIVAVLTFIALFIYNKFAAKPIKPKNL